MGMLSDMEYKPEDGIDGKTGKVGTTKTTDYTDPITPPPSAGDTNDMPANEDYETGMTVGDGVAVQDLYPEAPEGQEFDAPTVATPTGAEVTEADMSVTEMDTATSDYDAGETIDTAIGEVTDLAGEAEQTELTSEQQVDAELARILGQDSPLIQQSRAEGARMANRRGLQNSSMAAGMTYDAIVRNAMPMAQQNAQQGFQREMENTRLRQESGQFTAEQISQLRALEAELGQDLSIFNVDQLNQAERLAAEMRVAIEQGNQQAYNEASLQLAELNRDAEAQQAEIDFAAEEREFLERQAYNEQIIDSVTELNKQYMSGEQLIDIEHVRGTYNQIISTNETAASFYDGYMQSIGQILSNPDLSPAQAAEAIQTLVDGLNGGLRLISELNDLDLSGFSEGGGGGGGTNPYEPPDVAGGGGGGGGAANENFNQPPGDTISIGGETIPATGTPGQWVGVQNPMDPFDQGVGYYNEFGEFVPWDASEGAEEPTYNPPPPPPPPDYGPGYHQ